MNFFKNIFLHLKKRLTYNTVDNILGIINTVPSIAGFSLHKEKISVIAPFWIIHLSFLVYVYGVGNLNYQMYHAQGAGDFIKSYVNISLLMLIFNISYWYLTRRIVGGFQLLTSIQGGGLTAYTYAIPLLRYVIKKMKQNDDLAKTSVKFQKKHELLLRNIKIIVLIFYGFNYGDAFFIYLPHRMSVENEFSMTPCVGLEPLTSTPNRQICMTILGLQEVSIMSVVLNYQALLLLFIDHTSAMYLLLSEEIMAFDAPDITNEYVKEKLPSLIERHVYILDMIDKLKKLYSKPIGIDFASNAICITLFLYLPLQEWLAFIPILVYCFLVFFLYCFLCQRLVNAAEVFETAVYSCGWEKFDVSEKKKIYVMLLLAQRKVEILAADIIPVNIYTFASTLQAMFKFVTVVKF